jgi:drug/metabolite transporter (DMT)-like permease
LIAAAITGLSVHLCIAEAFRYGDAIVVVPVDFLRVPLIALIAWSFYGEPLDALVLAGSGLVIAGVIWNLRAEARAQPQCGATPLMLENSK